MTNLNRACAIAGCLIMLCGPIAAEETTPHQPPVVSGQPLLVQPLPPPTPQPLPIPPLLVKPMQGQPVLIEPMADPRPGTPAIPPAAVLIATAPVPNTTATIVPAPQAPAPVLGEELRKKLKADEKHFEDKSAAAQRAFDLRQAEEKKTFESTLLDKGFWKRRRLKRAFRAEQAQRRIEFDNEQNAKRRTYEWRYP